MSDPRIEHSRRIIGEAALAEFAGHGFEGMTIEGVAARDLQNALWEKKIRVRAQGDDKGVRLSAHVNVAPADIDRAAYPYDDYVLARSRVSSSTPQSDLFAGISEPASGTR